MGVCSCSVFCCTLLCVRSSIAIIFMGKRELVALLNLSSWCLMMVERLFLALPRGCLGFVIVVFPDHTYILFLTFVKTMTVFSTICDVLLYTAIFAYAYPMPHLFPPLRVQCKMLKHCTFARLSPSHVRGFGAWLKPTGILYLLGESSLPAES